LLSNAFGPYNSACMQSAYEKTQFNRQQIEKMLDEFGSPLFIVSERDLRERYGVFADALLRSYEHSAVAYSFKTNYLRKVCETLKNEGARAEVVSGFEYGIARNIGYSGKDIIFNGPHKTELELREALADGATINVDCMEELEMIQSFARSGATPPHIGLRLSSSKVARMTRPDGRGALPHRFGFNIENGDALKAVRWTKEHGPHIRTIGYHIHIAVDEPNPAVFVRAAESAIIFAQQVEREVGYAPTYIDMGGGFVEAELWERKKDLASAAIPSLEVFLGGVGAVVRGARFSSPPMLIFEPGRFIVSRSTVHITRVVSVKNMGTRKLLTVDSSLSILPTATTRRHKISAPGIAGPLVKSIVAGASCMARDVWGDYDLPAVRAGDILVVENCGAYSLSRSSQFITPRPAVVWISIDGIISLARRAETPEDITRLDISGGR